MNGTAWLSVYFCFSANGQVKCVHAGPSSRGSQVVSSLVFSRKSRHLADLLVPCTMARSNCAALALQHGGALSKPKLFSDCASTVILKLGRILLSRGSTNIYDPTFLKPYTAPETFGRRLRAELESKELLGVCLGYLGEPQLRAKGMRSCCSQVQRRSVHGVYCRGGHVLP